MDDYESRRHRRRSESHSKHPQHHSLYAARSETRSRSRSPLSSGHRHHESRKYRHGDLRESNHRSDSPRVRRHGRERSAGREERRHRRKEKERKHLGVAPVAALPFESRPLHKSDFKEYKPLFALYLDIQKQLFLDDLAEDEVKGRWKSFVGRWNRGELAEGWYDPAMKKKASQQSYTEDVSGAQEYSRAARSRYSPTRDHHDDSRQAGDESDEDEVGPDLPSQQYGTGSGRRPGPAIPKMQDLELQRELIQEDEEARREDMRHARKMDRKQQKEHLEDLVPRAEPGTRERQLEKKKELNEKMKAYRDKSPVEEVNERDLMGDDSLEAYRAQKKEVEKKKNERELRREEMLRARAEEREERLQEHRAKEDKTMAMLKALAKQNFG
ncbi:hypothetical protein L228DRAFT_250855 [Xylona heveae TC161]|uniref:Uncharacterized protein n=1 Tax=Xylona heveae (strain CBS 132557 / TC161) TaxID=1328760 RepID=A0A165A0C2_XYLHT|nr:hypothetical protein L228DRAFT_250855 [Xylona heveae TC161]KZF19770.1 hypothetical protein L228DRAFT_250855 [Xylona heveae TC161]